MKMSFTRNTIIIAVLLFVPVFVQGIALTAWGPASFSDLFTNLATLVRNLVGGIAGIMFIIAGILYATSAGDPQKAQTAKNCLLYAIIGTFIALAAEAIVAAIKTVTGTT